MNTFLTAADMKAATLSVSESVIRDLAGTVLSQTNVRLAHSSYGVSKAAIRASLERMDGAIGLYMVLSDQAAHAMVPALATFHQASTRDRVAQARAAVVEL